MTAIKAPAIPKAKALAIMPPLTGTVLSFFMQLFAPGVGVKQRYPLAQLTSSVTVGQHDWVFPADTEHIDVWTVVVAEQANGPVVDPVVVELILDVIESLDVVDGAAASVTDADGSGVVATSVLDGVAVVFSVFFTVFFAVVFGAVVESAEFPSVAVAALLPPFCLLLRSSRSSVSSATSYPPAADSSHWCAKRTACANASVSEHPPKT